MINFLLTLSCINFCIQFASHWSLIVPSFPQSPTPNIHFVEQHREGYVVMWELKLSLNGCGLHHTYIYMSQWYGYEHWNYRQLLLHA